MRNSRQSDARLRRSSHGTGRSGGKRGAWAWAFVVALLAKGANAQVPQQGFASERLYRSAAGAGWIVMDDLSYNAELGGAMSLSLGYARRPVRVGTLDVVSGQAFLDVGASFVFRRYRLSISLPSPLYAAGESGVAEGYAFESPSVNLGTHPDTISDVRIGLDARLLGDARDPHRVGAGAQLFIPSGSRADYVTDNTYRAMGRALFAGEIGSFTYAAELGIHIRPRDDAPSPIGPRGSELRFGMAAGPKVPLGATGTTVFVAGPEVFGQTALSSFFGPSATGIEALLVGRLQGVVDERSAWHVKAGIGPGLHASFGTPEWRAVFAVEIVGRAR